MSGCEINILKDCPTDYNRQAGIGFTIFMTTVLAFFSGSYAGWYFGESYATAIIFGLLWSALIFSIDRSMVVTLKKDPTLKKQKFWVPLISRGIMALLIAFIISIPLELLIFQENIELHMEKYKLDQTYEVQQAALRNEAVSDKEKLLKRDSINALQLKNELSFGEPKGDPIYDNLKSDFNSRNNKYQILLNQYNTSVNESNRAYNKVPEEFNSNQKDQSTSQWREYSNKLRAKNIAQSNLNKFDKSGLNLAKQKYIDYKNDWLTNKDKEKKQLETSLINQSKEISNSIKKSDTIKGGFEKKIQDKKGFVLRFMVLEDLASTIKITEILDAKGKKVERIETNKEGTAILFLLWLIRILFFTIEILPTIAKISTPLGAYDFAIYKKEKEIEEDLERRKEDYLNHQKKLDDLKNTNEIEIENKKNKIEKNLHINLLEEIALAQNDVAKKQIDDFRKKHLY
ncbi:hypothetical protein FB1_16050 [Flavobacterium branchiophilum NBRC 15030 = ATCC 35035]|uniref:DUF4407 domain-containing protein n=1 Tax=Flavobacterium branchiophilum TaxID=55197 RepID=UPI0011927255|nr:DUF4407 domain-containing protein [Flavobacterium branchiophilum]GEM55384.1 hypothetical protein FB1_16050 [Flavobacterium branchiophilum NBRC 15030 = ATCC 35035]